MSLMQEFCEAGALQDTIKQGGAAKRPRELLGHVGSPGENLKKNPTP